MTTPPPPPTPSSPYWSSTTKMVVGLTIVAVIAALLVQFRQIISPLLLAFGLSYLLHPLATRFSQAAKLPWRTSVNLIYLLFVVLLIGSVTVSGLAIVQQIQSLVEVVERFINDLPTLVADLSTQIYRFGPFVIDFAQLNLEDLTAQLLNTVQPMLGQVTRLVSGFAASAAVTFGWVLFILLVSYFLLVDAGRVPNSISTWEIPGYNEDLHRLGLELRHIWNAFLRGQMIIFTLVIISYSILLMVLGVRYAIGIAFLAGLARFVPYLGPLTVWLILALVSLFQVENYFGLASLHFAILTVVLALVLDQIFDNIVVPRFLGAALGVHPAGVLIAAIVATKLIGITGLVLAAPTLATMQLLMHYVLRKLFDQDPWPENNVMIQAVEMPWYRSSRRLRAWIRAIQRRSS